MEEDLEMVVRRFIAYLDSAEYSDSGKEFHPVQITCSRAALLVDLNYLVGRMKELTK